MKTKRNGSATGAVVFLVGLSGCGPVSPASEGSGSGTSEGSDAVDDDATVDHDASDDGGVETDDDGEDDGRDTRGGSGVAESGADGSESSSGGAPAEPDDAADGDDPTGVVACSCPGAGGFVHAWIANPADGMVSKIDVDTLATVGRFRTRAALDVPVTPVGGTGGAATTVPVGGPVSTSVSIDGRAVAVSNISGGVTKIWSDPSLCDPLANTLAGVQTSDDADALPWGDDECVAWHAPFAFRSQIPVAWGAGTLDPVSCEYVDQVVWTAGCNGAEPGASTVMRLDGDTGMVLDVVTVSAIPCATMGAVDGDGSFWIAADAQGEGRIAQIDADGALVRIEAAPVVPSGLTIDAAGHVWLSSRDGSGTATAARYTPAARSWDLAHNVIAAGHSGIAQDPQGRLWVSYASYMGGDVAGGTHIDGAMMHVGPPLVNACPTGGCTGMSIDFEGRVWSISVADDRVFRFDPPSGTVMRIDGMHLSPYGADITGWALQNAACASD